MIIPNSFIKLNYNPTADVLHVEWPNMHDYTLPEVNYIIDEIVKTVKNYDIKHVLADTRKSVITVPEAAYREIVNQLALSLLQTRLKKFARLITQDSKREEIASNAAALIVGSIQYRAFESPEEAMEWLEE